MYFATLLRYVDMKKDDGWDDRFCIPHFWSLMADKYKIGLNAIISEHCLEEICSKCDGLMIPGSSTNINPKHWGDEPFFEIQKVDEYAFDIKVIKYFLDNNKPILGICGGLQEINVALGGTLKTVDKDTHSNPDSRNHMINITENSFVYDVFKSTRTEVNSYHYWAIDKIAPGLTVVAEADDGIIEAIEWKEKRIFATQWHPERSFDNGAETEHKIFENFITCCQNK